MMDKNDEKKVKNIVQEQLRYKYIERIGDTPTEAFNLVNRKFVTANGSIAGRPTGSVATVGQFYYASDIPSPAWYTGSQWIDGVGSVIALS